MTTQKTNVDKLHFRKFSHKDKTESTIEKLLLDDQQDYLHRGHQSLIKEIKNKNHLLEKQQIPQVNTRQPNRLTSCQIYAHILTQKYNLASNQLNFKQVQNMQQNSVNISDRQEQIFNIIIQAKLYLKNCDSDFGNQIQKFFHKLRRIKSSLKQKIKAFDQKNNQIFEQLSILELFAIKINSNISKQSITPLALFVRELKSKTPKRYKPRVQNTKVTFQSNLGQYQTQKRSKKELDSNILTPHETQLLSEFEDKSKDQSEMLISFKPNTENLDIDFETLKYSESELNINLSKNQSINYKEVRKNEQIGMLPYSPVQPYKLQKQRVSVLDKKQITTEEQDMLYLQNSDSYIKAVSQETILNLKKGTQQQREISRNITSIYSLSLHQIDEALEGMHVSINQQKKVMEKQWGELLELLDEDLKDLGGMIEVQKRQNQQKDRRFLENLDVVQNQLIQQVFVQKEIRKNEENVLMQLLSSLIDSLQQGVS